MTVRLVEDPDSSRSGFFEVSFEMSATFKPVPLFPELAGSSGIWMRMGTTVSDFGVAGTGTGTGF